MTVPATKAAPSADVLLALAERCEREKPSRELDEAIARALNWRVMQERGAPRYWIHPDTPLHAGILDPGYHLAFPPRYTTSLDAAVTLVPEGCDWMVRARHKFNHGVELGADWAERHPPKSSARVWKMANAGLYAVREGSDAANPVAALCAAALRARAALMVRP